MHPTVGQLREPVYDTEAMTLEAGPVPGVLNKIGTLDLASACACTINCIVWAPDDHCLYEQKQQYCTSAFSQMRQPTWCSLQPCPHAHVKCKQQGLKQGNSCTSSSFDQVTSLSPSLPSHMPSAMAGSKNRQVYNAVKQQAVTI